MSSWDDNVFAQDELRDGVFDPAHTIPDTDAHDLMWTPSADRPIWTAPNSLSILAFAVLLTLPALTSDTQAHGNVVAGNTAVSAHRTIMPNRVSMEFLRLAAKWQTECRLKSSTDAIAAHHAYDEIIKLGRPAIPYILAELEREPNQWFRALRDITGEDPVPVTDRGRVKLMAQAWLAWGKSRGYQW